MLRTNVVSANAARPSGPGSATGVAARSAAASALLPPVGSRPAGFAPGVPASMNRSSPSGAPAAGAVGTLPPLGSHRAAAAGTLLHEADHLRRLRLRLSAGRRAAAAGGPAGA